MENEQKLPGLAARILRLSELGFHISFRCHTYVPEEGPVEEVLRVNMSRGTLMKDFIVLPKLANSDEALVKVLNLGADAIMRKEQKRREAGG